MNIARIYDPTIRGAAADMVETLEEHGYSPDDILAVLANAAGSLLYAVGDEKTSEERKTLVETFRVATLAVLGHMAATAKEVPHEDHPTPSREH